MTSMGFYENMLQAEEVRGSWKASISTQANENLVIVLCSFLHFFHLLFLMKVSYRQNFPIFQPLWCYFIKILATMI